MMFGCAQLRKHLMGSFSVECKQGDGERTIDQADGERRVKG